MDLLACAECEHRFYVSGVAASDGMRCPQCGGSLALAAHGLASIPLDARWLDPRVVPPINVSKVELHRKRERTTESGERIVRDLAGYFPIKANGASVQVTVNRGEAADAALRVVTILDGIDSAWEEHFYLAAGDSPVPPGYFRGAPAGPRRGLHVVRRRGDDPSRERLA